MSKIVSIGTAVPAYCHQQMDILQFMQIVYASTEADKRKMRYLYQQSGIKQRYSVIPDYSRTSAEWRFYPNTENLEPFPSLEQRMVVFNRYAPQLSVDAIRDCLGHKFDAKDITHLITVSCTGMTAPGLDLHILELLDLNRHVNRTSINFMGCYAAIHALKIADSICKSDSNASVLIVCTELCTLHFQHEPTMDNIASSLLFGDVSAAALVTSDAKTNEGFYLDGFHSEIISNGKRDMAWELSSTGFQMTLSGYIPDLIEEDFLAVVNRSLEPGSSINDFTHWCIHPGGKRILEAIHKCLSFSGDELKHSYDILREYGNLSSATILFVLKQIAEQEKPVNKLFAAAFGPGLTIETFTCHN